MTVAYHRPVALVVEAVAVAVDPIGDLDLEGLGEELLGTLAQDRGEDRFGLGQWPEAHLGGRKPPGGVLLCLVGPLVELDTPRVRRPFSIRYPQHSIIPLSPSRGAIICPPNKQS